MCFYFSLIPRSLSFPLLQTASLPLSSFFTLKSAPSNACQVGGNLADAIENGTQDQHAKALIGELNSRFEKCQQLLNSIAGKINSKAMDVELEAGHDEKKHSRGSHFSKRSRATEVHHLSERKRRDRINEKMKALQELIPRDYMFPHRDPATQFLVVFGSKFAMGLNMPAKTVVFTAVKKFDGDSHRYIRSGEYIQMSGRAGRRGKDDRGICIIMIDEQSDVAEYHKLRLDLALLEKKMMSDITRLERVLYYLLPGRLVYIMIWIIIKLPPLQVALYPEISQMSRFICERNLQNPYSNSKTVHEE
ncbi:hypothetical protein BVRB_4g091500 isoform C [Beta vulgaris subsp. vulgaris]|nr:hypothetical protein BVRB_4g091500 isoform C [Beta vulgaris subsp. vulgaris]